MKKTTTGILTLVFMLAALFVKAQEQGEIRVGAGLVYGTKASFDFDDGGTKGGLGINIGGEYFFTDIISGAPSYTFFFKEEEGGASVRSSSFNLDGRYYFSDGMFYGLFGLGFTAVKSDLGILGSRTNSETGLNLGGGVMLPVADAILFNGQLKYNTSFEHLAIQAGISYIIQ